MNGNTGQYAGYYHQMAQGTKPYPSPTLLPNVHWQDQNGHVKHPYSVPQQPNPAAQPNIPPQYAGNLAAASQQPPPSVQQPLQQHQPPPSSQSPHTSQVLHHPQAHYVRLPPAPNNQQQSHQQGPPAPPSQPQPPPPSNGPYPPPQRAYAPNPGNGEPLRYQPPPSNGNYYDHRKPIPNQVPNSPYPMYSAPPGAQQQLGQRHFMGQRKPYMVQAIPDGPRMRMMSPNFEVSPGQHPDPNRASQASPAFNNINNTPKKAPETLNDLLRKPINDNSRHLRQVLTSNLPPVPPPPQQQPPPPQQHQPTPTQQPPAQQPSVPHPQPGFGASSPVALLQAQGQQVHVVNIRSPAPAPTKVRKTKAKAAMMAVPAPQPIQIGTPVRPTIIAISRVPAPTVAAPATAKLDIVENTKPKFVQRKVLKVTSDVNMRKVILSLNSGLLAETKWAIESLLAMSCAQKTMKIQKNLILALLEHYKCNLQEIFDGLFENDVSLEELTSVAIQRTIDGYLDDDNKKDDKNDCKSEENNYENVHDDSANANKNDKNQDIKIEQDENNEESQNGTVNGHSENDNDCKDDVAIKLTNGTSTLSSHANDNGDVNGDDSPCDPETNQIDCNTGLSIIIKEDPNIPRLKTYGFPAGDEALVDDSICDRRKLGDVDTLDTSHITLNFDLDLDHRRRRFDRLQKQNNEDQEENHLKQEPNRKKLKLEVRSQNYTSIDKDIVQKPLEICKEAEMANAEKISILCTRKERHDRLIVRCISISNILYNVSFFKENHSILLKYPSLFTILSRILLYKHEHRQDMTFGEIDEANEQRKLIEDKENIDEMFSDFPLDTLTILRQNSFAILSNLAEEMNLCEFSDKIVFGLLDALLHWAVCRSAIARDPQKPDGLSFQLSALDILGKLTMKESNNDLLLATPPYKRIETFYNILIDSLNGDEDEVIRELSLVILSNVAPSDYSALRIALRHKYSISNIILCIEQYERCKNPQFAHLPHIMDSHYMVRRAAQFLLTLSNSAIKDEINSIKRYEERIRALALSEFLEDDISKIIADIMFRISK